MSTVAVAPAAEPVSDRGWRFAAERLVRVTSGGLLAGLVAGLLVGGLGGRVAMRVVAIQTPEHLQGLRTDDGATTGEITLSGSLGLIAFLTLVGVLGGLAYVVARPAVPARWRRPGTVLVAGVGVGTLVIHADGVDYTVLGSTWVSVAMFGAIAAGYGWVLSGIAERLLRPGGLAERAPIGLLGASFVALYVVALPVAAAIVALATRPGRRLAAAVRPAAIVAVRLALVVVVVLAGLDLAATLADLRS